MEYKGSIYNNLIDERENGDKLYYNSSSGAVAWLNTEVQNALDKNDFSQILDKDYFPALLRNAFITEKSTDEYSRYLFKSRQFIMEIDNDTASYVIGLTMNCNLNCVYCFERGRTSGTVSSEILEAIFEFIKKQLIELKKTKLHITWFGGEPFLAYEKIISLSNRVIDFCNTNNVEYDASIITNGILLTDETTNELIENHHLKNIQITIDGDAEYYKKYKNATEQQFSNVIRNIKSIGKRKDINLTLRLNTCKENQQSLLEIVDEIVSDDSFHCYLYAGRMMNYGSELFEEMDEAEFREFEIQINQKAMKYPVYNKIAKKRITPKGANCGSLACNRCVIDYKGRLYRCEHHINDEKFVIGDVKKGFYRNDIDDKFLFSPFPDKCATCSIFPVCLGGCTSDRLFYDKYINCEKAIEKVIDNVKKVTYNKNTNV